MPLDTEVGLGPGDIVLDADPAPPPRRVEQPLVFGPCLLWPNGRPSQLLLNSCFAFLCSSVGLRPYCNIQHEAGRGAASGCGLVVLAKILNSLRLVLVRRFSHAPICCNEVRF